MILLTPVFPLTALPAAPGGGERKPCDTFCGVLLKIYLHNILPNTQAFRIQVPKRKERYMDQSTVKQRYPIVEGQTC